MKGFKRTLLLVSIILTLLLPVTAFAADSLYRLMHNDQQALVIAEVVESNQQVVEFKVEKSIISEKDLNKSSKIPQLEIESFTLNREELTPIKFFENIEIDDAYKTGDTYLVSLNEKEEEEGYEVGIGVYKLDSSDYESADVLYPGNSPEWRIMEAMAVKEFINTDGAESEFTFDGDNKILRSGDRVVYDGKSADNKEAEEDEKDEDDKEEDKEEAEDVSGDKIEESQEKPQVEEDEQKKDGNNVIYILLGIVIVVLLALLLKRNIEE